MRISNYFQLFFSVTGVVRLGVHCTTKEKVAVKIIDRTKLSPQILSKVRIKIMK